MLRFCFLFLFGYMIQGSTLNRSYVEYRFTHFNPAFIQKIDDKLIITSFGSEIDDGIHYINNFETYFNEKSQVSSKSAGLVTWPNEIKKSPQLINGQEVLASAGGFFVPPFQKQDRTGSIDLFNYGKTIKWQRTISPNLKGWFYHKIVWRDMNNDGRLDIVTARSNFNPIRHILNPILFPKKKVRGELIWFEQPANAMVDLWPSHTLLSGPELAFEFIDLDDDGVDEILASESFQQTLNVYWQDGTTWKKRTLSDQLGLLFGMELADLNNDGALDLVVTNHEADEKAGVFAFEIPSNFKEDRWQKIDILTGIETRQQGPGEASPGGTKTFKPFEGYEGKPWILLSGDGSQRVHLLTPVNSDPENWQYKEHILLDTKSSVTGGIEIADFDSDGWPEIVVPEYHNNLVTVLSLKSFVESSTWDKTSLLP